MKKTVCIVFCVIMSLLCLLCAGCEDRVRNYPVTVGGAEIADYPTAAVSLSPYISEIIYGLELSQLLVGRSTYCAFNGNVRALPDIGTVLTPDVEKIISLAPQVVFSASALPEEDALLLKSNGIQICVLPIPASLQQIRERTLQIASVLKGNNRAALTAQEYLDKFDGELAYVENKLKTEQSLSAVFVLSNQGAVATGDTVVGEIMKLAGLVNVADGYTDYNMPFEDILAAQPDVIIVTSPPDIAYIYGSEFSQLAAAESGLIYQIDNEYAERVTPGVTDLLYGLAYTLHGEAMAAPDVTAESGASSPSVPAASIQLAPSSVSDSSGEESELSSQ